MGRKLPTAKLWPGGFRAEGGKALLQGALPIYLEISGWLEVAYCCFLFLSPSFGDAQKSEPICLGAGSLKMAFSVPTGTNQVHDRLA